MNAGLHASLERAGAVLMLRDGDEVATHFGSAASEVAVCRKSVGLAVRSDLRTLELAGPEAWLEVLLERQILLGDVPAVGEVQRVGGGWCARIQPTRALVVGGARSVARWERVLREAIILGTRVASVSRPIGLVTLSLIGPRARRLTVLAGLPDVAPGRAQAGTLAGGDVVVFSDGADRALLLVDAGRALAACEALLDAGRSLGVARVGRA
jgi:glycine cleavage system aminomethyltransferase T